jgi:Restriction endonuclease
MGKLTKIQDRAWKQLNRVAHALRVSLEEHDRRLAKIRQPPDRLVDHAVLESLQWWGVTDEEIASMKQFDESEKYIAELLEAAEIHDDENHFGNEFDDDDSEAVSASSEHDELLGAFVEAGRSLQEVNECVRARNTLSLRATFDEFFQATASIGVDLVHFHERIDELILLVSSTAPDVLYIRNTADIIVPKLIVTVSDILIDRLRRSPKLLTELEPRQFEELIAELFLRQGFEVHLTAPTRDGGKDIIAFSQKMGIPMKFIIECKRYAMENRVGLALVQRLLGVKVATKANKAILATTSTFTRDARQFASDHFWDLDLKDHRGVMEWVRQHT